MAVPNAFPSQVVENAIKANRVVLAAWRSSPIIVLKANGYRTALYGKWHLGAKAGHGPLDQGFETYFGHLSGFIDNYRHCFLHGRGYHDLYDGNNEIDRRDKYYPDLMVQKAVDYIDANQHVPFFMTVAFNLPHYPEQPIDKFRDAYPDMPMPRQSYARVISSVDDHIGLVLEKLDQTGLRDRTIVIMMSDNGHSTETNDGIRVKNHVSGYPVGHYYLAHGGGGNTGKWIGHKGEFLEGGIRVPTIISYPGRIPASESRDQVVTVMDWFPTILELCGIQRTANAPKLDGHSMMKIIASSDAASAHDVLHFAWAKTWAVRKGEWKLISDRSQRLSLRKLTDPKPEVIDYVSTHPEIVTELTALHQTWELDVNRK